MIDRCYLKKRWGSREWASGLREVQVLSPAQHKLTRLHTAGAAREEGKHSSLRWLCYQHVAGPGRTADPTPLDDFKPTVQIHKVQMTRTLEIRIVRTKIIVFQFAITDPEANHEIKWMGCNQSILKWYRTRVLKYVFSSILHTIKQYIGS